MSDMPSPQAAAAAPSSPWPAARGTGERPGAASPSPQANGATVVSAAAATPDPAAAAAEPPTVARLAAEVAALSRCCKSQSLKPTAVAARASADVARVALAEAQAAQQAAAAAAATAASVAAAAAAALETLARDRAALDAAVHGPDNAVARHPLDETQIALRICRFAADTAERVLELAHVGDTLRTCAVEFGGAIATLPDALTNTIAIGTLHVSHGARYWAVRAVVERNRMRCPWLAELILASRHGAPIPRVALADNVTRHDVRWRSLSAEGWPGTNDLQYLPVGVEHNPRGHFRLLRCERGPTVGSVWARGDVGVSSGRHFFSVVVFRVPTGGASSNVMVGWADDKIRTQGFDRPGCVLTDSMGATVFASRCSGAAFRVGGGFAFGTAFGNAPLAANSESPPPATPNGGFTNPGDRSCVVGALLDLDASPPHMQVFIDGVRAFDPGTGWGGGGGGGGWGGGGGGGGWNNPGNQRGRGAVAFQGPDHQCPYAFPAGVTWWPVVSLSAPGDSLRSCA
jgi:hypothetical protein